LLDPPSAAAKSTPRSTRSSRVARRPPLEARPEQWCRAAGGRRPV
jgi:hypothetical protein